MKIYLRDRNPLLYAAWKEAFGESEDVHISCGDIFAPGEHMNCNAIVSPANSFGFMDGGLDFVYSSYFGWGVQDMLREELWQNYGGELLVGQAVLIDMRKTNPKNEEHKERINQIPYLISAPTMRVPSDVSHTVNAFLAFRAALRIALAASDQRYADAHRIESVLCPGLGTAIGKMAPRDCAVQMYEAYKTYKKPKFFDVLGNAHTLHYNMMNADSYLGSNYVDRTR